MFALIAIFAPCITAVPATGIVICSKQCVPSVFRRIPASERSNTVIHHLQNNRFVKMACFPPIIAAVPLYRAGIVRPHYTPLHNADSFPVSFMLRVVSAIRERLYRRSISWRRQFDCIGSFRLNRNFLRFWRRRIWIHIFIIIILRTASDHCN